MLGMESQVWCDLAPSFVVEVYDYVPEPPPKSLLRGLLIALGNFQLLSVKDKFAPDKVAGWVAYEIRRHQFQLKIQFEYCV